MELCDFCGVSMENNITTGHARRLSKFYGLTDL